MVPAQSDCVSGLRFIRTFSRELSEGTWYDVYLLYEGSPEWPQVRFFAEDKEAEILRDRVCEASSLTAQVRFHRTAGYLCLLVPSQQNRRGRIILWEDLGMDDQV